jgi:hypothetical protein
LHIQSIAFHASIEPRSQSHGTLKAISAGSIQVGALAFSAKRRQVSSLGCPAFGPRIRPRRSVCEQARSSGSPIRRVNPRPSHSTERPIDRNYGAGGEPNSRGDALGRGAPLLEKSAICTFYAGFQHLCTNDPRQGYGWSCRGERWSCPVRHEVSGMCVPITDHLVGVQEPCKMRHGCLGAQTFGPHTPTPDSPRRAPRVAPGSVFGGRSGPPLFPPPVPCPGAPSSLRRERGLARGQTQKTPENSVITTL